ncbi:hypothetical protein AGMMS4952_21920 [Spirochaetia bacterium]|nr:hypothetical protein AGMMS4952_21920 [Spirochaetia bacterium]
MILVEKKLTWVLLLVLIIGGSVYAQERIGGKKNTQSSGFSLSAGGRIFYNGMFDVGWEYSYFGSSYGVDTILENSLHSNNGFGIGGFFDATYVEIGMDFIFGSFKPNANGYAGDFELMSTQFGFTILGKFPFAAGPVTVFPLAGIDYQIFLSGKNGSLTIDRDDMSGDFKDLYDAFSLVVGVGLDFNITSKLYLRGEVLVNFKIEGDSDKALKKIAKDSDISFTPPFTFGPRVSIGVGYKFWNK